ncbi:MAG: hypothetical protein KatS3mg077_2101 [Candidatus Binatia bacterium]|nr:MAG: hypothetical protein KatS3mg077_2101 [Candidatus Binatia bacterium]
MKLPPLWVGGGVVLALLWPWPQQLAAWSCIRVDSSNPSSRCIYWPDGKVTVKSLLGAPARGPLLNGTRTWDENTALAANEWNAQGANVQITLQTGGQFSNPCGRQGPGHACDNTGPPGDNPVIFANDFCGRDFGDIIQLTNNCYRPDTGTMVNAPVFINAQVRWNAYDGPIRFDTSTGRPEPVYDIRRVVLHELGHVLGLAHPDEANPPQTVVAIMNSRVSNIDRLQADDVAGLLAIYPREARPQPTPSQGCTASRGQTRGSWPLLWVVLLVVLRSSLVRARLPAARRAPFGLLAKRPKGER